MGANLEPGRQADDDSGFFKPWMGMALLGLVLAVGGYFAVASLKGGKSAPKRQTVKIAVLPDTPPPPPPPPPKEKPPEPEKQDVKPQPQQEQKPQEAPPEPQQLKMDGPAGDGPSAFAAGTVNSEYKGGDIGTGAGGGAPVNRMQFALFSGQLQRHIQTSLARDQSIKLGDYRVPVQIWLSPNGDFERIELLESSGDPKTDQALQAAFRQLPPMRNMPPDLPQPIRVRITNRMTG